MNKDPNIRIKEEGKEGPGYDNLLKIAVIAAIEAGNLVMSYYKNKQNKVRLKWDLSPVTEADREAGKLITERLAQSGINIISEEAKKPSYRIRKNWAMSWIIDPIDGTRDYIAGGNDFTVNIGLAAGNEIKLGVIYIPVSGELFYGIKGVGAYKQNISSGAFDDNIAGKQYKISPMGENGKIVVVTSRSDFDIKTKKYIESIQRKFGNIEIIRRGSSIKYCLVAEGKANLFPRLNIINEWDTAAGQAIAEASGCFVAGIDGSSPVRYNKKRMATPPNFVASNLNLLKKISDI